MHSVNYERGAGAAPFVDEVLMLPLNLVGVGEVLTPLRMGLRTGAAWAIKTLGRNGFRATAQTIRAGVRLAEAGSVWRNEL